MKRAKTTGRNDAGLELNEEDMVDAARVMAGIAAARGCNYGFGTDELCPQHGQEAGLPVVLETLFGTWDSETDKIVWKEELKKALAKARNG